MPARPGPTGAPTVFLFLATLLAATPAAAQVPDGTVETVPLSEPLAAPAVSDEPANSTLAPAAPPRVVVLGALDKVTARISKIRIATGRKTRFGTLEIVARTCTKRPPEEEPETTAFLEIVEAIEGAEPELLFSGWMFASSPALSALEHPVYDVWVLDCLRVPG